MSNFFHSIAGKIAMGISSIIVFFSGGVATTHSVPQQTVQNATSSVASSSKLNLSALKEKSSTAYIPVAQRTAPSPDTATKQVIPIKNQTVAPTEENFREVAITTYKKPSALLKQAIEETRNSYLPEINSRREKLVWQTQIIRKDTFTNSGDGIVLNKMLDLFASEHEKEIRYIDQILGTIEANLNSMAARQSWYDNNITSLMDERRTVTLAELTSIFEQEKNSVDLNYAGIENINTAMKYYYESVIMEESEYEKAYKIIMSAFEKISGPTTATNVPVYQPIPPPASLPQLPKTTYCTYFTGPAGGLNGATVQCN